MQCFYDFQLVDSEDPSARTKGTALEDLVEDFIRDLQKLLRQHKLPCHYHRNPSHPGRGRTNIDFLLLFGGKNKTRYYFYIDSKNTNRKMKYLFDIKNKIHKKFDREKDFWETEKNSKKTGMVVGSFRMNPVEIEKLKTKNIHYLDLGELGTYFKYEGKGKFFLDKDEKIFYDVIMRGRLIQFLAFNTRDVFESFPSNYSIEIKDEKNFSIIKDGESLDYNVEQFEDVDYLPVNYDNMIDSITIEKGLRGGVTIISPWKCNSLNPEISVRNTPFGTTLFKTKWGRKRK